LFPKTSLDGTTVTSADLELPGTLRTLAWVVVLDDAARMGLHLLMVRRRRPALEAMPSS
jgi:hypothetical protein